ncbi:mucin TcMUC [Trypanosoma cruzi]|uniref:Mucin TcMUC n=1 Tax=Trypanosoma cruzi TaxID=5693 RepID=A0A7J6XHD4_TRYCR|nr:mucin TcMUC [Trypanosoma cruzi]
MQTSANIQTETQINGCLPYSISCEHFCVYGCCCCDGRACMKWCALNMNEGRRQLNCFCDEYWLHFPWTNNPRGVRGSLLFHCYFAFLLLCALHLLLCVCVPSVRGADTTDRSRRMCMRWSLVCRSCLLLPLPSVCWCCGRAVCVCVPVAVDWSVCRAWCAAYGACLAAALSSCGVPSVCVCRTSRLPCCSPCPSLCRSAPHH